VAERVTRPAGWLAGELVDEQLVVIVAGTPARLDDDVAAARQLPSERETDASIGQLAGSPRLSDVLPQSLGEIPLKLNRNSRKPGSLRGVRSGSPCFSVYRRWTVQSEPVIDQSLSLADRMRTCSGRWRLVG